ncbi:MAG: hypothetical protein AAF750_09610 [Planctomycetota bacterium]
MSDPNPPSKRPRRRRRSNRDRPKSDPNTTPPANAQEAPTENTPATTGYSNSSTTTDPKPQSRGGKKPRQNQNRKPAKSLVGFTGPNAAPPDSAPDAKTQGKPKPKRKKPRTKTCFKCFMPCLSLFRVQVDHTARWKFVCDMCWDAVAENNPHYKFGGVWPPPRQARGGKNNSKGNTHANADSKNNRTPSSPDSNPRPH